MAAGEFGTASPYEDARTRRDKLTLHALLERRVSLEEETRTLRAKASELSRLEAELRDEVAALDAILGARREEPAVPAPAEAPAVAALADVAGAQAATGPARKRRRKGSRMEEMLPKMRARFAAGAFDTEALTDLVLEAEGGERRKAYFAAWSLVRDLAEDGVVVVVSEDGEGPRKKRTFRFAELAEGSG